MNEEVNERRESLKSFHAEKTGPNDQKHYVKKKDVGYFCSVVFIFLIINFE